MLLQWKTLTSCHRQMIQDAAQHMSVNLAAHCQDSAEEPPWRVRACSGGKCRGPQHGVRRRDAKKTRGSMPRPFVRKSLPRTLPVTTRRTSPALPLQTTSRERSGRCKCSFEVHMPRKTGEEQVLLLAVPMLRERSPESSSDVGGPIRTACSRKCARQQPGECWLCEADPRAEVRRRTEVTSRRRWLSASRRRCVLQCSDGGATPGCDATWSLQARRQTRRRATANCDSPHQRSVNATRNRPYCK